MKIFLKSAIIGLVSILALEAHAKCFWSDVSVSYDGECKVTSIKKGGKEATGDTRERILDKIEEMLREKNGDCKSGGRFDSDDIEIGGGGGGGASVGKIQEKVKEIMFVSEQKGNQAEGKKYLNNIESVRENQNKMKLNAITRSIALGRRAVALAMKSGEDIDGLRVEIEQNEDMLNLMKSIAKLQAQHLQKINQTTALRSRLLEMNAIDAIIAADIQNNDETSENGGNADNGQEE